MDGDSRCAPGAGVSLPYDVLRIGGGTGSHRRGAGRRAAGTVAWVDVSE